MDFLLVLSSPQPCRVTRWLKRVILSDPSTPRSSSVAVSEISGVDFATGDRHREPTAEVAAGAPPEEGAEVGS